MGELDDLIAPKLSRVDFDKELKQLYEILKQLHLALTDHEERIIALEKKQQGS